MNKLNEKCILNIKELIKMEELFHKKCKLYSELCTEPITKTLCLQNSAMHKAHFLRLKSMLETYENSNSNSPKNKDANF